MKKLGKMKLNDFHQMSESEMKDVVGGYQCLVYSMNQSSGHGYCEEHPMSGGVIRMPNGTIINCDPEIRVMFCGNN